MDMTGSSDPHTDSTAEFGYEKKDISVWKSLVSIVAVVLVIVFSLVLVDDLFVTTKERMIEQYVLKPESIQLRELQAKETEILTSYAVLDKKKGIYRIPISRAMKLMADEAYRQRVGER